MAREVEGRRAGPWSIAGLGADGPFPGLEDKLRLFGQFVGDWEIVEDRNLGEDGTLTRSRGELHWGWILGGRAVQDVWMTIDEETGRSSPDGTTVRFYDPAIDAWHSVWLSPNQGAVKAFVARAAGDEIVLEGKTADGRPLRWFFSEIAPDSFRWHSERSLDGGKTWMLTEEMRIRRKRPAGSRRPSRGSAVPARRRRAPPKTPGRRVRGRGPGSGPHEPPEGLDA